MGINEYLDTEIAIEELGDILDYETISKSELDHFMDNFKNFQKEAGIRGYSIEKEASVLRFTWRFSKDSTVVQKLKDVITFRESDDTDAYIDSIQECGDEEKATHISDITTGCMKHIYDANGIKDGSYFNDASRLTKVIREGFANAIMHGSHFGEKGDIEVLVEARDNGVLIKVTDPGEGFQLKSKSIEEKAHYKQIAAHTALIGGLQQRNCGTNIFDSYDDITVGCERYAKGFSLVIMYSLL